MIDTKQAYRFAQPYLPCRYLEHKIFSIAARVPDTSRGGGSLRETNGVSNIYYSVLRV